MRNERGESGIGIILLIAVIGAALAVCDISDEIKKTNAHLVKLETLVEKHVASCPAPPAGVLIPREPVPNYP